MNLNIFIIVIDYKVIKNSFIFQCPLLKGVLWNVRNINLSVSQHLSPFKRGHFHLQTDSKNE